MNTGSVYKDYGLLKNGFPGECVANSSVSVVKTHERGPLAFQVIWVMTLIHSLIVIFLFQGYKKAVLLVRDPSKAIQAEFNRQGGGHIGFAPPHRYKLRKGKCKGLIYQRLFGIYDIYQYFSIANWQLVFSKDLQGKNL